MSVTTLCYKTLSRKSVTRVCTKACHEGLSRKSLAKVLPSNRCSSALTHLPPTHLPIYLLPNFPSAYLQTPPICPPTSQPPSLPTHLITYLLTSLLAQLLPTHTLFVLLTHPFLIPLQTFSNAHARMTSSTSLRRLSLGAHATCH